MKSMIEYLVGSSDMKDTLIVPSTLIPSDQNGTQIHREDVNQQYRDLVMSMKKTGVNIVLADMDPPSPAAGNGWISWPDNFTAENGDVDDTHPNDYGYAKMTSVWYDAITDAHADDLIPNSVVTGASAEHGTCEKSYGNGIYAGGLTQRGSGEDDGIYQHSSESMGTPFWLYGHDDFNEKVFFARMYSQKKNDLLVWDDVKGYVRYYLWKNNGGQKMFSDAIYLDVKDQCIPKGVNFIDINGEKSNMNNVLQPITES
jgi:hypothetical protein